MGVSVKEKLDTFFFIASKIHLDSDIIFLDLTWIRARAPSHVVNDWLQLLNKYMYNTCICFFVNFLRVVKHFWGCENTQFVYQNQSVTNGSVMLYRIQMVTNSVQTYMDAVVVKLRDNILVYFRALLQRLHINTQTAFWLVSPSSNGTKVDSLTFFYLIHWLRKIKIYLAFSCNLL